MPSPIKTVLTTPTLRVCAVVAFGFGLTGASTGPYQSVVAIRELGLSDFAFSVLSLSAAIINVLSSIWFGLMADRGVGYRALMIWLALCGVLGFGAIWLLATPWAFVIAILGPVALFSGLNGLIFSAGRVYSAGLPGPERASVTAMLRGMFSMAWILVPGLVGFALAGSDTLLPAYGVAAVASGLVAGVALLAMPRQEPEASDRPARVSMLEGMRLTTRLPVAVRVLAVASITAMMQANGAVMPLIVTGRAGGVASDVGTIWGMVAALEVVFILVWARIVQRMALPQAIALGAGAYVIYLLLLSQADSPMAVRMAAVIGAFGAAAIITLPLGYLQDLLSDRPGLSASLISMNLFLAAGLGSGHFALGTMLGDYPLVALLAAAGGGCGALGLLVLERGKRRAEA